MKPSHTQLLWSLRTSCKARRIIFCQISVPLTQQLVQILEGIFIRRGHVFLSERKSLKRNTQPSHNVYCVNIWRFFIPPSSVPTAVKIPNKFCTFCQGANWYVYELKKEKGPLLLKIQGLFLPQRRIFYLRNYAQTYFWIFGVSTSYDPPQTPIHSLSCHIQQIQQNLVPFRHIFLFLFLLSAWRPLEWPGKE